MTGEARKRRSTRLLRQIFERDTHVLTCQPDRDGRRAAYSLSLVPHWNSRRAITKTFDPVVYYSVAH